jgi:hypothetical protein
LLGERKPVFSEEIIIYTKQIDEDASESSYLPLIAKSSNDGLVAGSFHACFN